MPNADDGVLDNEPLPSEVEQVVSPGKRFRVTGYIDVVLSGFAFLLLLCGWFYVIRHRKRRLCALRIVLGFTATLWVLGLVASHGAIWGLAAEFVDLQQALERWDRDQLCGLHACVTLGFAEPASLLLIAALIRAKTLPPRGGNADVSWWLVRRSLGLASLVAVAQAVVVGPPLAGTRSNLVFNPLPYVHNASDGAVLDRGAWWRDGEGCANSAASVSVRTGSSHLHGHCRSSSRLRRPLPTPSPPLATAACPASADPALPETRCARSSSCHSRRAGRWRATGCSGSSRTCSSRAACTACRSDPPPSSSELPSPDLPPP